jgi:hypothetical protein
MMSFLCRDHPKVNIKPAQQHLCEIHIIPAYGCRLSARPPADLDGPESPDPVAAAVVNAGKSLIEFSSR